MEMNFSKNPSRRIDSNDSTFVEIVELKTDKPPPPPSSKELFRGGLFRNLNDAPIVEISRGRIWKSGYFLSSARPRGFPCGGTLSCRGEGRLIGWQKVMSFHVGCTHAGTRVTSWLHGCFRSTCRSIEFPIVTTLRSHREIRSVLTFPNIRNHERKTKEGLTKRRWEKIWLAITTRRSW